MIIKSVWAKYIVKTLFYNTAEITSMISVSPYLNHINIEKDHDSFSCYHIYLQNILSRTRCAVFLMTLKFSQGKNPVLTIL